MHDPRVIVALDFSDQNETLHLVDQLDPAQCRLKVGKELFTRYGPVMVKQLIDRGFAVFLDLKFHDIPTTVARACQAAADLGVWMLNVHALGGPAMLEAARNALTGDDAPHLIAVTWLTSSGQRELDALGIEQTPQQFVSRLTTMARQAGCDGVVCSAQEADSVRQQSGDAFLRVTPGIRLDSRGDDDQQRVMTPQDAVKNGASYLVIGRPVTRAEDPCRILLTINSDIARLS